VPFQGKDLSIQISCFKVLGYGVEVQGLGFGLQGTG